MATEKYCPTCGKLLVPRPNETNYRFKQRKFCSRKCAFKGRKTSKKYAGNHRGFRMLTNRICAREGCNRKVPQSNRMLCMSCYLRGGHLGEPDCMFNQTDRDNWRRGEQAVQKRIERQVKIYSAQNMKQEELWALVPSQQKDAA